MEIFFLYIMLVMWTTELQYVGLERGVIEDYVIRSRYSSSCWHLFKVFFFLFSWIIHVFISCLRPHFHFTITISASQSSYLMEHRVSWGGRWRVVHINVNDTETIYPGRKRNGRIPRLRRGREVMKGWSDKKMDVVRRWLWWNSSIPSPGQPLNS